MKLLFTFENALDLISHLNERIITKMLKNNFRSYGKTLGLHSPWVCVIVPPLLGSVLLGFKAQNWAEGLEEGVSILDIMSARVDKRRNATGSWAKITDLLPTNHNGVTGKKILGATRFKATATNHIYIVIRTLSRISFSSCLAKHFQIRVKVQTLKKPL